MGNKSKFRRSEQQLEPGPSSGKGIRVYSTRVEQGASFGPLPVATGDEKLQLAEIKENPSLQSSDNFKERPLPSRDGDDSSHNKTSCLRRNQLKFGPADEIPARARANQLGSAGGKRFDHFMSKWSNLMRGGGKTLKGSLNLSSSSSSTFPAATSTGASREPAIRGAELKLASNEDKFVSENPRVLVNISTTSGASWRDESEQEAPPSRGLFVCSQAASGSKLPKQSLERRQDLQRASASRPKQRRYWFHLKSALSSSTSVLSSGTEQSAGSRPPAGPLSARKQQVEARSQSSCERASNPEASPAKSKRSQHSSPYRQMATLLFGGPSKGQQDLKQSGLAGSVEAEPARASSLDCNKSKRNKLMQFALARACNQGSTPDEQRPMEESKRRELEQPEADVVSSLDRRRVKGKVKNANGAHGGFGLFNNSINFVSPLFNRRPYKRRARAPPEIGPPDQAKRQPQWNNNSHANVESATDASDANVWPDGLAGNNKNLKSSLEASDKQLDCEGDLRELIDEDDKKISIQAIGNQATVVACRGRNRAADHDNIASYGLKFGSVRTEVVCHANEPQSLDGRRLKSGGTNDSKVNNNIIINNDSASQTNLEAQKSVQGADQRAATGSASPPNEIGAQQELVRRIENGRSKSNYASGDILDKQLAEGPRQGRVLIAIGASNQAAELGSGAGACGRANGAPQEAGLTALDPGWKMNDKNTDDLEANDGEADINRDDIDPAKPHLMLAPIQASCSAATTASNSSESNSLSHQNSSRLSFSSSSSSSSSSLSSSLANLNSLPSSSQCNSPLLDLRKLVQSGESAEVEERRQQQQPEARRRTKISIAIQEVDVTRGDKENQGSIQIQDENQRPKSQPETRIREGESNREEAQVGLNKKLVKRQQSVDSYRTARDLRNKMRRQQQSEKGVSSRLDGGQGNDDSDSKAPQGGVNKRPPGGLRQHRKYSMRPIEGYQVLADKSEVISTLIAAGQQKGQPLQQLKINIESSKEQSENQPETGDQEEEGGVERPAARKQAKPPNTLVLMPSAAVNSFVVGSFSGCITPTYPTHHLPSPKYVSPSLQQQQQMQYKKYSNASTISSSFGGGSESLAGYQSIASIAASGNSASQARGPGAVNSAGQAILPSDTESSIGAGSVTPSILFKNPQQSPMSNLITSALVCHNFDSASSKLEELAAAAKRALLAEHIYDNKCGLGEDMKFLASLPELCDITFLVGETREPVCAVKSVLAARSRVFHKILFGNQQRMMQRQAKLQQQDTLVASNEKDSSLRRDSSPRGNQNNIKLSLTSKTSSPIIGATNSISAVARPQSISPVNSAGKQWSVTTDYNGLSPTHISDRSAADQFKNSAAGNGGRISVTSAGHESLSQISQGSQQPLIIGPGQMAAPAPVSKKLSKKSSIRDKTRALQHQSNTLTGGRLSRMFTKRASDPSIKQQQQQQQILLASNQNYLDKMSRSQMSTTMIIEEFEPDVFRQLIEYIHTGCVMLQARTLLGLLNAADYYGLEQLRKACLRFVTCCITVDTVCSLLSTAERYIQYKCTKSIVQKVLEFVDSHADEIFKLNAFGLLPEHVVRLILSRDGLKADEHVKYNGVYTWCEHYCRSYELTNISDVMRNFLDLIQFHKIPTNVLLSEIYPTHIVPDNLFLSALAYQAEPQDDEIAPNERARRMTLPNPTISKRFDDEADDEDTAEVPEEDPVEKAEGALGSAPMRAMKGERQGKVLRESTGRSASSAQASSREPRRVSGGSNSNFATGQHQQPQQHSLLKNRKSTGEFGASLVQKASKLRKGSIAQASINGMMKLSHKLSIKKRHTHSTMQTKSVLVGHVSTPEQINFGRPRGSSVVLAYTGGRSSQQAVERQESNSELIERGKQILDAWQREMEQKAEEAEEERKRKLEEESAKRRSMEQATANSSSIEASQDPTSSSSSNSAAHRSGPRLTGTGKQGQSGGKSSRASMKDFKNISKIFMRKPSSKLIRQQASATSEQSGDMTKSLSKKLQRTKIQESTNDGSQPIP